MFSRKKHSDVSFALAPAGRLARASSRPEKIRQSQPDGPWSAHSSPSKQSPSIFLRDSHALSTNPTAASELFLFGGYVNSSGSLSNDLYVISTCDFSTTRLQTSGDVPSPRFGHRAVFTGTSLLIWGGRTSFSEKNAQLESNDDSLYLLNFVSREWTRIVVNGPRPSGRYYHTMTLVGSKLFVFGGKPPKEDFNKIWILDLNCLRSNPSWESYEPASGDKKPPPRAGHVSVTTGDRIIIFGGCSSQYDLNDTWSFNILTRKWTELLCTGSIPPPRAGHAAVLIDDVIYVYGGVTFGGSYLGDLTALDLSTQRWVAFQDTGLSPSGRSHHAMACDGTRIFMLGGALSPSARVDEAKLIHVLDTKLLVYPKSDSNTEHSIARLEDGRLVELERQLSEALAAKTERDRRIRQLTDELAQAKENAAEEKRRAGLELRKQQANFDRSLQVRDRAIKQVLASAAKERMQVELELDKLIANFEESPLYRAHAAKQPKTNAAEENKQAGMELREPQAKLDKSLQSRDQTVEQVEPNVAEAKGRAGLEPPKPQGKLDRSLQSQDHAIKRAGANAAKGKRRSGPELRKSKAKPDGSLLSRRDHAVKHAKANAEAELRRVKLELRESQAKLDKSLGSRKTL